MVIIMAPRLHTEWDGVILIQTGDGIMAGAIPITGVILTQAGDGVILIMAIVHGILHVVTAMAIMIGMVDIRPITPPIPTIMEPEQLCTGMMEVGARIPELL